jgi:hypothetical protein
MRKAEIDTPCFRLCIVDESNPCLQPHVIFSIHKRVRGRSRSIWRDSPRYILVAIMAHSFELHPKILRGENASV